MQGLRIFIQEGTAETAGGFQVFYSRRSEGPYYRWWYEVTLKQWRAARVSLSVGDLCASSWRNLPGPLRKRLTDHYLE